MRSHQKSLQKHTRRKVAELKELKVNSSYSSKITKYGKKLDDTKRSVSYKIEKFTVYVPRKITELLKKLNKKD